MRFREQLDLPARWRRVLPAWMIEVGVAISISALAVGARMEIDHLVPTVVPFALVFPAVVGAALLGGWRAGLLTIVICQGSAWYFLLPVHNSFRVAQAGDAVSLILTTIAQFFLLWSVARTQRGARDAARAFSEQQRLYRQTVDQQVVIDRNQEDLGAIFSRSADGMTFCRLIRDARGNAIDYMIVDANPAHAAHVGLTRDDVVDRPISTVAPPINPIWVESAERVVRTKQPQHFEIKSPLTGRWLEIRVSPIVDDHFAQTYIDVTDRKVAEQERDEAAALLQTFLKAVPGVVYVKDREGRMVVANQGVADLVGKPPDAFIGRTDLEFLDDKAQAEVVMATDRRIMESGRTEVLEEDVALPDGRPAIWLSTKSPLRDAHGAVVGLIGSSIDFTEQSRARALLARSQEELEREISLRTEERDRLWRNSQDLLLVARFDGTMLSANPAWNRVLGWSDTDLLGMSFTALIHPDDLEASAKQSIALSGEDRSTMQFQNRFRTKSGDWRWLSWAVTSESGLFHGVARDVTAERQAVEALNQAQKMDAVGQLTGGLAHDFNNLLAVVMGSLDLLRRRVGVEPKALRYIEAAIDASRRAALLTQRLLAFSRQQPLKPEIVDANKLVAGMSDLLRHALGEDVRLETVLAGGLWRTYIDANQLESVILNLAVNGRDAMEGGGRITIETQNAYLDERYVEGHSDVKAGQYVLVAVTDTGAGMPQDVMTKAFEPFFTTKPVGKGTGLGLSQVYGFVKQSRGHVKIYSEPGQGTTVKVYVPRHYAATVPDQEQIDGFPPPRGQEGETILVVEDEASVRQLSIDALLELGYRVLAADSGKEALRVIEAHEEICLLFTDVVMPEMNGARLAEEARKLRPHLRILFTSGYIKNAVVHNGMLDPGVNLIGKPFTIDSLGERVRAILNDTPPFLGSKLTNRPEESPS